MKTFTKLFFSSVILLLLPVICFAETLTPESKVSAVTVYPGSARVTRVAQVDLTAGEHSIEFKNIIPQLDQNSITVGGKGTAQVKIFGAQIKQRYLTETSDERVKELEKQLQAVQDNITTENGKLTILDEKKKFLDSIQLFAGGQLPKDLVTKMPTTEELGTVLNFLAKQHSEIAQGKEDVRLAIRELRKEETRIQNELSKLRSAGSTLERSIVVDLACGKSGKFTVEVSYFVYGADWRPIYDARAVYDKNEIELTAFGMVKQTTGEDWEEAKLTLSTSKPTVGGRMPFVGPWILLESQPPQPKMYKAESRARSVGIQSFSGGGQYDEGEYWGGASPMAVEEEAAQVSYATTVQTGLSVVYTIVRPVTIKSDGEEQKLPISTQTLTADFEYSSFPKTSEYAYLGTQLNNSTDLQLLAGEVNLFLDGEYVGKSSIENIGPGQEFYIYLGINENVKVTRKEVEKKKDDVLIAGIKSSTVRTSYKYKLMVENNTGKPIKVNLFEAMPVSENERIKVKIDTLDVQPTVKDWKDRKGVWRWEFPLPENQKMEIFYSFSVEHPREMEIVGL